MPPKGYRMPERQDHREESREAEPTSRKARSPLGVPRLKMNAPKRPGYVQRWVNDDPGRLEAAQEGGYEFVSGISPSEGGLTEGVGSKISRVVGSFDSGKPKMAYLMEIKKEWYGEDQEKKMQQVDMTEGALRRGQDTHGAPGQDGRYVPKSGISIDSKVQ